jgi:RNA-directed DNA polymerase
VKRKTASTRLSRALKRINTWCRRYRHAKIGWQHQQLVLKLRGHYGYYGITGNTWGLEQFRAGVIRRWRKWLSRRSQRSHMSWVRVVGLLTHYPLPQVKIVHAAPKA